MPTSLPLRIGVDTGGTFTDFVALAADGTLRVHKLRSTPHDPSEAILGGLRDLLGTAGAAEITHGSTVATNALLERKGARIALVCTAGFEDVLLIGRQTRRELYNFQVEAARPLVEPALCFGVAERMAADGGVLEPLMEEAVADLIRRLEVAAPDAVAVCLLHSYRNPAHERRLAEALAAAGLEVSASHVVLPEYREFERWATTAVNAYVTPLMRRYLERLQGGLEPGSKLRIMQSNGGSISARAAASAAVETILSGPAAGVVGAQALGAASGYRKLITFDMGGTSTDVALVGATADGRLATTSDSVIGDLPIRLPVLDIGTVGAGGGSVAWLDSGGSLRVGPQSAGADPGPVCYGRGEELTVTDANLLLGRLDPAYFLGGRMELDRARTERLAEALAGRLGLTVQALAEGVVRIGNSNMERAIRTVSVARGHDPRDFALLAFGGAGGLHCCALAESLDMRTVLIPEHSGVLSALGMLLADVVKNFSASILQPTAECTHAQLEALLAPLAERARRTLEAEGFAPQSLALEPTLAMRYIGQAYEIAVPFAPGYADAFHLAHARLYGYSNPQRPSEIVQLRLQAAGRTDKPSLVREAASRGSGEAPKPGRLAQTFFDGRALDTPVFRREQLSAGDTGHGPALLLTCESTNVIPPGWGWTIDPVGTLVLIRQEDEPSHA